MLQNAGASACERLSFYAADLERDAGWAEAAAGCDYALHVASPIGGPAPKHEDEQIVPARDGTLRVLRAARDAGVKRVVLTSSCGAIYYGHPLRAEPFDETSWTNLDGEMSAYVKSKAIAERAAWDFVAAEGGALELSVVNPSGIFGPALGADAASSTELIARLLNGMPGCPQIYFGVVDVRDVADLHLRAMTHPAAKGERFIAVSGEAMSMFDIAVILQRAPGRPAKKVPTRAAAELARADRRALRPAHAPAAAAARQGPQRDEREGRARARLEAALARGRDRRDRREPAATRNRPLTARDPCGSPGRARTADLVVNSHPLYQLSYRGMGAQSTDPASSIKSRLGR